MSLIIGTNSWNLDFILKSSDILKIINLARASGLMYIKIGDMELRFGPGEADETKAVGIETPPPQVSEEVALLKQEQAIDEIEDDLQSLQIDDPARFEEALLEREIEFAADDAETP